jgi:hypothetical protein
VRLQLFQPLARRGVGGIQPQDLGQAVDLLADLHDGEAQQPPRSLRAWIALKAADQKRTGEQQISPPQRLLGALQSLGQRFGHRSVALPGQAQYGRLKASA